jgi:recombination protein RecA
MAFGKKKPKGGLLLSENKLRAKYPMAGKASDITATGTDTLCLPSRILPINWQLGGGIYWGKILEIFGYESTGKSLIALDFAYTTQALGGIVLWGDHELCFTADWGIKNGLDMDRIELFQDISIERFSDWQMDFIIYWRSKLVNNEPILLVCDSTAALDCEANLNTNQFDGKAEMGNRAKAIYKMLRIRNELYHKYGVCVIYLNQVREKVGASMFEESLTTPGGAALKFYAAGRLFLARGKQVKDKEGNKGVKVGQNVYVGIKKNKLAPPRPNIQTQVYFNADYMGYVGYNKYMGLCDILEAEGILKKQGNSFYYTKKGEKVIVAKSRDKMEEVLGSNTELRSLLIKRAGINSVSQTQIKLDAITKNLYPVKGKKTKEETEETEE